MANDPDVGGKPLVKPSAPSALPGRVASVDALRGLTILLMIFVNDLGRAAPAWLHHIQPPNADGMTLADVVFPAFLFIVGVSIPLAFERQRAAGTPQWRQLLHVLTRTAGLLFMGVIVYNSEEDTTRVGPWWTPLAFTALLLAWAALPRERGPRRNVLLVAKALGALGLLALLAVYRSKPGPTDIPFWGHVENWQWLHTGWWGILGLIGWAYLTVALLVLLLGGRREWLMGALALLILVHLAFNHGGLFGRLDGTSKPWLGAAAEPLAALARGTDAVGEYVSLRDATGSLAAITTAGCLLGTVLRRGSDLPGPRGRIAWALTFAAGLLLAGFVTDPFEGINKIAATPTWCLWSAAITCLVWVLLYLPLDVAGWRGGAVLVRPAGANPLVAYFLHPILVELVSAAGFGGTVLAYRASADPWVVIGASAAMAAFVCAATSLLGWLGLRVRL